MNPQDFVVYESRPRDAAFNCTFDDSKYSIPPTIMWELNDDMLPSGEPAKYSIFSYKYTSFLQIHEPLSLMTETATVKCVAVYNDSFASSEAAILTISGWFELAIYLYMSISKV